RTSSRRLRVVPLGTSAGRPTLARGASALAVAAEGAWVLCDCGEGAQVAALRAGLSLSRLDAVLITHLHGDHFNGLPGLLGTLGLEGRERPLTVAGPRGIATLLETLARAGALGIGGLPVQIVELDGDGGVVPLSQDDDGFRVTAVQLGRGADVLVHESTYEHARAELAHSRGHSTGVEAARIASEAQAGTLLLTHFSPSVDAERVADEARAVHPRVTAAADLAAIE